MDFGQIVQKIVLLTPPILLAVTIHELAHGWMAWRLGDPTARQMGRLSLNPLRHLDPVGTLVFFVTQSIGWAKPVPVDPRYFKNPRQGMVWVSLAGPGANFLMAAVGALLLRAVLPPVVSAFPSDFFWRPVLFMIYIGVQINIGLAVFNLLPVPPLDGSKVVAGILPLRMAISYQRIEPYGFIILLALIFTGVTDRIIVPLILFLNRIFMGLMA